jgi:hypothetical protein
MRARFGQSAAATANETPAQLAKRQAAESTQKAEEEKRRREREAWKKAQPKIAEACAAKCKTAKLVNLVEVVKRFFDGWNPEMDPDQFKNAKKLLGEPKSVEDLGRALVFSIFLTELANGEDDIEKHIKQLGVDVAAILKEFAPKEEKPGRAKSFDEPTCTVCGCTEGTPCINGIGETCAWTTLDKKTNVGVCSSCEAKSKRKAVHTSAKAAARKVKTGKPGEKEARP